MRAGFDFAEIFLRGRFGLSYYRGRASEFENAIEWLCLSGIVSQVYKVEQIKKPLENYVNVQFSINGYNTYYWESQRGAEVDFVIQREGRLIPIEVKSADNARAKNLKVYMDTYKLAHHSLLL